MSLSVFLFALGSEAGALTERQGLKFENMPLSNGRFKCIYSRTSMTRTLIARYPGCFELILESLRKNPIAAYLG